MSVHVELLGAPVDLGADRRGVDMGPSAIRYAGLLPSLHEVGCDVTDLGNLPLMLGDAESVGSPKAKYMNEIVRMAGEIALAVEQVSRRGNFPLILGGDHSVSLGSVAGTVSSGNTGLLWLDAHGDFNTPETTPSGNVHGMILAALAGYGDAAMTRTSGKREPTVRPEAIALIGVRDLDSEERELLRQSKVRVFTMSDIDHRGMAAVVEEALHEIFEMADRVHLSLDMDAVDPSYAPGVGTPVPGGLDYREGQLAMEIIHRSGRLSSMDVVEVNPILDHLNQTAELAVEFILSALGKRTF